MRYTKSVIAFFICATLSLSSSLAINYNRPEELKKINNTSISHIFQTDDNAIWFSTSDGLHRFNGKNLELMPNSGWKLEVAMGGGRYLWSIMSDGIYRIDGITRESGLIASTDGIDFTGCKCLAQGDSLLINSSNRLYCCNSDSLYIYTVIPENLNISSLLQTRKEGLLISTTEGKILNIGPDRTTTLAHDCGSAIQTMYEDGNDRLWIGLKYGGVICYDSGFENEHRYFMPVRESRALCEDKHGNILVGSSDCMYTIYKDGTLHREHADQPGAHCITKLMRDRDGNIWIGTFYNGVYYSTSDMCPFSRPSIQGIDEIMLVNDVAIDKRGDIWIGTDQYGTHRLSGGNLTMLNGTKEHKSKSLLYDPERDCLWIGRHQSTMACYNIRTGKWTEYPFYSNGTALGMTGATKIIFHDGELLIGSSQGVWKFDPSKENRISRRLEGHTGLIHDVTVDSKGRIWAGGNGLYVYFDGIFHNIDEMDFPQKQRRIGKRAVTSMDIKDDEVWVATRGLGVLKICDEGISSFNTYNSGIADNQCHMIKCTDDGNIIIGTTTGISVMNGKNKHILNFHESNGLHIGSTREGCMTQIDGGKYIAGGTNGIEIYDPAALDFTFKEARLHIESIQADNNEQIIYSGENNIVFNSRQKNFSFNLAAYEYENTFRRIYEYKLEGFDSEWQSFDIARPVRFMYMDHGNYIFKVRSRIPGEDIPREDDIHLGITLKPRWYEAAITQVLGILLILAIIGSFLFFAYSKLLLRQELKHKEDEHNERTRFFIRVSHELRTPLSLILGQMEMFFKKNDRNIPGVKHLENTYRHALEIKRILGSFTEIENKVLSPETDDLPSESELEALTAPETAIHLNPITDSYTMLIIDDNAPMRTLLRSIFSEDYKILEAINGADGLELARSMQPDIIISDVMMPVMDGLTLCAKLRSNFTTSHIPIILLTAHVSEKHNVEGMNIGADDYIAKPFSVDILVARCKNLLSSRKRLQERYSMTKPESSESSDKSPLDKKDSQFINAVIGAIERHIHCGDLNASTLANELSVSTSTLNNRISAICKMSTRVFIEDIKLRHAVKMIKDGHNISETADTLGFSSPKYFTIRFKKKYGKTPSSFK